MLAAADGVSVVGAVTSTEALALVVASTRPDVVVLDIEIGAEAVAAARAEHKPVAIVVVWPAAVVATGATVHVLPGVGSRELVEAVVRASHSSKVEEVVVIPDAPAPAPTPAAAAPPRVDLAPRRRSGMGKLAMAASLALLLLSASLVGVIARRGAEQLAGPPSASAPHTPTGRGSEGSGAGGGSSRPPKGVLGPSAPSIRILAQPIAPEARSGEDHGGGSPPVRTHEKPRSVHEPEHEVGHDRGRRGRDHRHPRPDDRGHSDHHHHKH